MSTVQRSAVQKLRHLFKTQAFLEVRWLALPVIGYFLYRQWMISAMFHNRRFYGYSPDMWWYDKSDFIILPPSQLGSEPPE